MRRATIYRRRSLRRLAILRRLRRGRPYNRHRRQIRRRRIGSWNVRRWGSTGVPCDPWTKTVCLLKLAERRNWDAILLADVRFESDGVHTVELPRGGKWKIVVAGMVAIALASNLGFHVGATGLPQTRTQLASWTRHSGAHSGRQPHGGIGAHCRVRSHIQRSTEGQRRFFGSDT